ncbi:MAG: Na(+)-dependent bicarbonate transporter BicA [uncultured Adhaeribacter sp.]|uniref:Na(+)-dependent bicarbonate transporter BicA n=1 Tax=uncultured Adhaeribacter sp. TaxID=448109 RepID=A0A6J4I320_9BACT|nr:MAG: Na(+)-dependent bicarbonate transporter BicA [uncultured Adhaeribacter sp.]
MNLKTLKNDIPASIVVFLVALPLCLGVALASGAPLLSGIISGIIGGIVVGLISKSQTSVSGPAAGLAAVVLAAITQLGSFELFLSAVFIAGLLQLIMGFAKAGFIANYIPSNVIKGLLAAIGLLLILKQIPHAIGYDQDPEDDYSFVQPDGENTFSGIYNALRFITPGAVAISLISVFILYYWDKTFLKKIKLLPASLFVVIMGIVLNLIFKQYIPYLGIEQSHLVTLPPFDTTNLAAYLHVPNPANLGNYQLWIVAFTIAIVASLETLLNLEAVDKLDPHKRESAPNRELIAQGFGNVTAGLLGGIPVTSVIVRSSVNIQSGNETKLSTILHGVFMLVSVLILSPVLNLIPLSALAAILIMTGYKLAKISLFKEMYQKGWSQFLPFVITILAIIFTDLLIGVLIGLAVSIFYLMRSNYRNPFVKEQNKQHIGEVIKLDLPNQVSFLNKASIKNTLWDVPANAKVLIDASNSDYVDNDILEIINDFKQVVAPERNIQLNIIGLEERYWLNDHIQFINVLDRETQQKLKPAEVLDLLKIGNERFKYGKWTDKYYHQQVDATSSGQNPMAVIITCIDSRTSPEIIFDAGLGDILTIRIAGNIISPEIIGSLEIAAKLGAKLIVVEGHSNCGAIGMALANETSYNMGTITTKIQKAVIQCGCTQNHIDTKDEAMLEKITRQNVQNSIAEILDHSPYLRAKIDQKEMGIVAAYHNLTTSKVDFGQIIYQPEALAALPDLAG